MKKHFLIFLFCAGINYANAQLQITNGAEIKMSGTSLLTLQDMNLVNDGTFNQTEGTVHFSGNTNTSISGSQSVRFNMLELAKGTNNRLLLQRNINVDNQINFITGYLDLNGFNTLLSPVALLTGELETSRITATTGGYIEITNTLNAPSAANPGNLGAIITSAANLGSTTIRRGHQSQTNGYGQGNSIRRYYDIMPANNSGLNASLRFRYFDAELNGLTEAILTLWKSSNNISWTDENFTSRNVLTNYVEKTGIADFSRWTLTTPGNALPVKFILFNVKCIDDKVMLHWKTAFEQNSSYYEIQRSADGVSWMVIGSVPAAGYSSVEKSYTFTDINPLSSRAFYRIAEFDISGSIQYTGIVTNNCSQDERIQYWLNPVTHQLYVTINSAIKSTVTISVFDTKGALAGKQQNNLLEGNNQLVVNMNHLANGTYFVSITGNKGQNLKTIKVIKQQ